jgi:hypothetical protein
LFWERYVESKLDYKSGVEVLKNKHRQAREDFLRLLQWLEPMVPELRYGQQVELLREVFAQQYQQKAGQVKPVKEHATGVVRNPHDPDRPRARINRRRLGLVTRPRLRRAYRKKTL